MSARFAFAVSIVLVSGCTGEAAHQWAPPGGPTLALELPGVRSSREEDERARWELESGLVVILQSVEREMDHPTLGRDPGTVADALSTRFELGDSRGELTGTECRVLGRTARCLNGWTEVDGDELSRSGAVFELGEHIVWLDVAGDRARQEEVRRQAQRLLDELVVGAG